MTRNATAKSVKDDATGECPYLSGKKAEKCPWIEPACQAWKLQHEKSLPKRMVSDLFDTMRAATEITKDIWEQKATKGRK